MSPQLLGRIGLGDEDGMELNLDGQTWWCFKLPRWKFKSTRWEFRLPWWDFLLAYPASRHPPIREAAFGNLESHRGDLYYHRGSLKHHHV